MKKSGKGSSATINAATTSIDGNPQSSAMWLQAKAEIEACETWSPFSDAINDLRDIHLMCNTWLMNLSQARNTVRLDQV